VRCEAEQWLSLIGDAGTSKELSSPKNYQNTNNLNDTLLL